MENIKTYYGIIIKNCDIKLEYSSTKENLNVSSGALIKVLLIENGDSSSSIILLYDNLSSQDNKKKQKYYSCRRDNIMKVPDVVWPFIVAIDNKAYRNEVFKNIKFIYSLQVGNTVTISISIKNIIKSVECTVAYIGKVDEIGEGSFFGLNILNIPSLPEFQQSAFLHKYFDNTNLPSIIISADYFYRPFMINESKKTNAHSFVGKIGHFDNKENRAHMDHPSLNCLMDANIQDLFNSESKKTTIVNQLIDLDQKSSESDEEDDNLKILKLKQELERLENKKIKSKIVDNSKNIIKTVPIFQESANIESSKYDVFREYVQENKAAKDIEVDLSDWTKLEMPSSNKTPNFISESISDIKTNNNKIDDGTYQSDFDQKSGINKKNISKIVTESSNFDYNLNSTTKNRFSSNILNNVEMDGSKSSIDTTKKDFDNFNVGDTITSKPIKSGAIPKQITQFPNTQNFDSTTHYSRNKNTEFLKKLEKQSELENIFDIASNDKQKTAKHDAIYPALNLDELLNSLNKAEDPYRNDAIKKVTNNLRDNVETDLLTSKTKIEDFRSNELFFKLDSQIADNSKMNFDCSNNKKTIGSTENEEEFLKLLDFVNCQTDTKFNGNNEHKLDRSNTFNSTNVEKSNITNDDTFLKLELEYRKLKELQNENSSCNTTKSNISIDQYKKLINTANIQKENMQNKTESNDFVNCQTNTIFNGNSEHKLDKSNTFNSTNEQKSNITNGETFIKLDLEYRKLKELQNESFCNTTKSNISIDQYKKLINTANIQKENMQNKTESNDLRHQYIKIYNDSSLQNENIQNQTMQTQDLSKLNQEYLKLIEQHNQTPPKIEFSQKYMNEDSYYKEEDDVLQECMNIQTKMEKKEKYIMQIQNSENLDFNKSSLINKLFEEMDAMRKQLDNLSDTRKQGNHKKRKGATAKFQFTLKSNQWKAICCMCTKNILPNAGILLYKCKHIGCRSCFISYVNKFSADRIICPYANKNYHCRALLESYEIKQILDMTEVNNIKQNDEIPILENEGIFKCKTPKCKGMWITEGDSNIYLCPLCEKYNCVLCKAIHAGQTCQEYRKRSPIIQSSNPDFSWECSSCTFINSKQNKNCEICGKSQHTATQNVNHIQPNSNLSWMCQHCTYINKGIAKICGVCAKTNTPKLNEYLQLLDIEENALYVANKDPFQCEICFDTIETGDGVRLRGCLHDFCRNCIAKIIEMDENAEVKCPLPECKNVLQDREIMGIVPDHVYVKYVAKSLREGKKVIQNGFECQTPNCNGFWIFDKNQHLYDCPLCAKQNCVPCRAIHTGMNCKEYQDKIFYSTDPVGIQTRLKLERMLQNHEAMRCPNCQVFVVKNGGCPNMYCLMCRKGFVWAPANNPTDKPWICGVCGNKNQEHYLRCKICFRQYADWMKIQANYSIEHGNRFNCSYCKLLTKLKNGITLENCKHFFCKKCLRGRLVDSNEDEFRCIYDDFQHQMQCKLIIKETEILEIFTRAELENIKIQKIKSIARSMENAFVCQNSKCHGWWIIEHGDTSDFFICPLCNRSNCRKCVAIHSGMTCKEFMENGNQVTNYVGEPEYKKLMELESIPVAPNKDEFECSICLTEYGPGEGVILKECLHIFCKVCIEGTVKNSEIAEIRCPFTADDYACDKILQEREIKAIVNPDIYQKYLELSLRTAKLNIENGYQCQTINCIGWWINDENINEFECPICNKLNCLQCRAIHPGENCQQYQDKIFNENDPAAQATKAMLENLVKKGEAMHCPQCHVIIARTVGCDWLQCTMCRTEICWITKGPRRGPNGCKCREVNGKYCHPKCGNCH